MPQSRLVASDGDKQHGRPQATTLHEHASARDGGTFRSELLALEGFHALNNVRQRSAAVNGSPQHAETSIGGCEYR